MSLRFLTEAAQVSPSTSNHKKALAGVMALIAAIGLSGYAIEKRHSPPAKATTEITTPTSTLTDYQQPFASTAEHFLKIDPDTVLAWVNGRPLKTQDVLPPGAVEQSVSRELCDYFLHRAIDRELILQTARAQGLELDESQKQQILDFKTIRGQTGPGMIQDLNGGASEVSFEIKDIEAFMLQTSLVEESGASPNVTPAQVLAYYQEHASEFSALPAEESAKVTAWNKIDFQIREKLASAVRSDFQNRLVEYMNHLRLRADIQLPTLHPLQAQ